MTVYTRYKHLVIVDADAPPTYEEIRQIENAIGAKLPDDLLNFLDVANGGEIVDYTLTVPVSPPEEIGFSTIFSTKRTSGYRSFLGTVELLRLYGEDSPWWIPEKVLPIAYGASDCYLHLDLRIAGQSPVMAFIHGLPPWTGLVTEDTLLKVADSFTEYLHLLRFAVDEYKDMLQTAIEQNATQHISALIDILELALPDWREQFGIDYDDGRPRQLKLWDW